MRWIDSFIHSFIEKTNTNISFYLFIPRIFYRYGFLDSFLFPFILNKTCATLNTMEYDIAENYLLFGCRTLMSRKISVYVDCRDMRACSKRAFRSAIANA